MTRTLSAPGKLFLSGEYAVLWGGTSRVLATGGRVTAAVHRRDDRRVDLLLSEGRLSGRSTPAGVSWDGEVPAAFSFLARTVDLAFRASGGERNGFSLAVEPSRSREGRKLGIGSSARAVVLAAEAARSVLDASFDALKLALLAHHGAQGGRGSGADVAACFVGGLVRYRRYDLATLTGASNAGRLGPALDAAGPVDCARTDAPRLPLVYAWTGDSAATPALIRDVEARIKDAARLRFVETSDALGAQLELALSKASFAEARDACAALQAHLGTLGVEPNAALERILAMANVLGCCGKQSGAGGGDGVVLMAPHEAAADLLVSALTERGLFAERLVSEPGLRGEGACPPALKAWLDTATG